jgi:hypothetical protein
VDAMIQGFMDDDYTPDHIINTLPVICRWNLSADQRKKLEEYCLAVFQGKASLNTKGKEKIPACLGYLGIAGASDATVNEHMKNNLAEGNRVESIRALGGIAQADAKNGIQEHLDKQKKVKKTKDKAGKTTEEITSMARPESVAAAVAFINMGDKAALDIVKTWLTVNKDKTTSRIRAPSSRCSTKRPSRTPRAWPC